MNKPLALDELEAATKIRREISQLYKKYHALTAAVQTTTAGRIKHFDIKRAVDAIHYFGGGWPHANSKGRMEALLDSVAGMYKILDLIGEGDMVRKHLAKRGITIDINEGARLKNHVIAKDRAKDLKKKFSIEEPENLSQLLEQVVVLCDDLQGFICQNADIIRDELRPSVKKKLGIDDPEYKRLEEVMKLKMGSTKAEKERMPARIKKVGDSMTGFRTTSEEIKKLPRKTR